MSELKRPERYVQFESIKPGLKEITEFYTQKVTDYQYRLKQLNEYADSLENEISVLKETPKVEVLLDDMPKPLVVVPQIMADFIEVRKKSLKLYDAFQEIEECYCGDLYNFVCQKRNGQDLFARAWLDGYTVEKEKKYTLKHIDLSKLYTDVSLYLAHGFYKELDHVFYKDINVHNADECHFTQSEIDELNIGSYEKIEVHP